ncbi:hypothetical protein DERP_012242 [Dermatophagoides pteronyssinus]|uniref:Uncharacterized protein n=1 Tax=Dermatophagoides pteronyssinus TaxID=6956 RepID=A0ABQ8JGJ8_DERPT|nr:hypothetical protein DERP_012242 [Dermatophagoides pteronyssinus]
MSETLAILVSKNKKIRAIFIFNDDDDPKNQIKKKHLKNFILFWISYQSQFCLKHQTFFIDNISINLRKFSSSLLSLLFECDIVVSTLEEVAR